MPVLYPRVSISAAPNKFFVDVHAVKIRPSECVVFDLIRQKASVVILSEPYELHRPFNDLVLIHLDPAHHFGELFDRLFSAFFLEIVLKKIRKQRHVLIFRHVQILLCAGYADVKEVKIISINGVLVRRLAIDRVSFESFPPLFVVGKDVIKKNGFPLQSFDLGDGQYLLLFQDFSQSFFFFRARADHGKVIKVFFRHPLCEAVAVHIRRRRLRSALHALSFQNETVRSEPGTIDLS